MEWNAYRCPECNQLRMNTRSGSVCPDGHGRLYPKINAKTMAAIQRSEWVKGMPVAEVDPYSGHYRIAGLVGLWQRIKGRVSTGTPSTKQRAIAILPGKKPVPSFFAPVGT